MQESKWEAHDAASDVGADERESAFNCGQTIKATGLLIKLVSLCEIRGRQQFRRGLWQAHRTRRGDA